jgi:hypothetical protein
MNYEEIKNKFELARAEEDGYKVMLRVADIVNRIGRDFLTMNGGELSDARTKLAGYKFYLADYIHELNRISKSISIELKNIKASEWDRVDAEIKARDGKVKNKTQIENVLEIKTRDLQYEQMLYETMYNKYKLKISALDDVLMAITQKVKELQKELDESGRF